MYRYIYLYIIIYIYIIARVRAYACVCVRYARELWANRPQYLSSKCDLGFSSAHLTPASKPVAISACSYFLPFSEGGIGNIVSTAFLISSCLVIALFFYFSKYNTLTI